MSFPLTSEQEMVQSMVRGFARSKIEPIAARLDRDEAFPADILGQLGELGLMGMMVPAEYGGSEAGAVAYSLAMQEIAYSCASTSVAMSVNNLSCDAVLAFGSEEQKQRHLVPMAQGRFLTCFALTEPGAGSDPGGMRCKAARDGDDYVVNGTKAFITNGAYAKRTILVARTGDARNKGLSAFIVETDSPGLSVGSVEDKMGLRASNTVELVFEDCRVPVENRLGEEGDGFRVAMVALDGGRVGIASQCVGIGQACLDEAVSYARERKQFGRPIADFQAIQWMIADMATEIEAARLLTFNAAAMKERGEPFTREVSMAKLFASEMANRVAARALQIHGGYGYSKHYKIERLYRDARVTTIYEGTSEVQRLVIARRELEN